MAGTPEIARENGKKGGRPKGSKATHTIQAEAGKQLLIQMYMENVRPLNQILIDKALGGDIQALKELHDRVHGRAPQAVNITGEITSKVVRLDIE